MLSLAISPCPNDTFIFCAMASRYRLALDDVEALNRRAEGGEFDVTKISVAAYGRIRDRYALLRAGGAAGFGVGPLLVATAPREPGGRIAVPGERTTAALLLRLLGDFETVSMRFDLIEDAVLQGVADCGVLIHEGRFTYERKGLVNLADLGQVWEERMRCPLPLGAIAIRRELGPDVARRIDGEIRESLSRARAHPGECAEFVRCHAQEMSPDVIRSHIDLYVNDYTLDLDEAAVERLVTLGERQGLYPPSEQPIFAYG
ncbi:MAG TPA: 1,4-dihydroxy-6-naphthoate synthase [Thermoanaerobaculia bacterium]|nr:1,4-dihydroxy-6-naphthoate synthase [Thermoanaerobaculia bacterium]